VCKRPARLNAGASWATIRPVTKSVYSRTLQKAVEIVGGRVKLCRALKVPAAELDNWLADKSIPPQSVFLQAVDLVVDEPSAGSEPGDPPSDKSAAPGAHY